MTASACAPGAVVVVRAMCVMSTTLRHISRKNASSFLLLGSPSRSVCASWGWDGGGPIWSPV